MGRKIINFFSDVYYTVEGSHAMLILIKVKIILMMALSVIMKRPPVLIPKLGMTVSDSNYFHTYSPVFVTEWDLFRRCHIMA